MRIKECNIEEIMLEEYRDFSERSFRNTKGKNEFEKDKKALTMVMTASVALSAAGCGKDVAKNNMTEEKTVETTVQESPRTIVRCGTTKGF